MSDELGDYLNRILAVDESYLKYPRDEVKAIFLHDIRMFYSPIETALEVIMDADQLAVEDRDKLLENMKLRSKLFEKYVDKIDQYFKMCDELKNGQ